MTTAGEVLVTKPGPGEVEVDLMAGGVYIGS